VTDDSISEETSNEGSYKAEVPAHIDSVSIDGTPPEVGDEVDVQVKGTVARIEGDTVCITPTEVNGQPAQPVPGGDDSASERDSLRSKLDDSDEGY